MLGQWMLMPRLLGRAGVAALWNSLGLNVARNAIINTAELASYDQTILKLIGFKDDVVTHLFAGLGAVFFAVCVGSPVAVGPLAFYKGFLTNFARLGSWNVIMFLTMEQVQKLFVRKPTSERQGHIVFAVRWHTRCFFPTQEVTIYLFRIGEQGEI